ncbi:MAG: hypothetical protein ABEH77_04740 [Halobacteriaceae archaeon]
MDAARLQRLCGLCLAGYGFAGVVAPRRLLRLKARLALVGFEGDPPDPRDWLVEATRTASLAALVAGLVAAAVAGRLPGSD